MKRAHLFDSLTFRVTLAYLLFLAAAVALLLAGGWWFGVQAPLGRMERLVAREAREIAALYHASGPEAAVRRLELRRRDPLPTMAFHALIERDGSVVSANLPSWPAVRRDGWQRFEADLYRDGDEDDHEALSRDMLLPDGRRLIVGRDIEAIADRQELIEEGALWGSLAVLLLGLSGGLVLSRTIGRRLDRVARMARTVMAGDLGGRIETSGTNDDFDRLSRTLNLMLDRIEELVASVSRVSDSIAHELRTPLTRLRADLDTLVRETGGDRERMLAARAVAEAEALQRTFDSLLRIARLETGRHAPAGEAVALDALLAERSSFTSRRRRRGRRPSRSTRSPA